MITPPAFAAPPDGPTPGGGPNFQERVSNCVNTSVAYSRYATMANDALDTDHAAFIAFIQEIADKNSTPEAHAIIINLGKLAWANRGHKTTVQEDTMKMFNECYDNLGTKL